MDPPPQSADNDTNSSIMAPLMSTTSTSDHVSITKGNTQSTNETPQAASVDNTSTSPTSIQSPSQQGEPLQMSKTGQSTTQTENTQETVQTNQDKPEKSHKAEVTSTEDENKKPEEIQNPDTTSPQKVPQSQKKSSKSPEERLLEAISTQNIPKIHEAVRSGVNVNAMLMASNAPPIIVAAKLCFYDVMEALLQCGANPNCIDAKGWAPLHWASVMNNLSAVRLLCNHGADIYIRTCGGKLALDLAELKKHKEVKDFLLGWVKHTDKGTGPKVPPVEVPLQPFLPRHPSPLVKSPLSTSVFPPSPNIHTEPRDPAKRRVCTECNTTETPQWRRGPQGPETLCNRCGLRYSKKAVRYSPY